MKRGLGFTLLELLIAIAIIGVLAAVGFNLLTQFRAGQRLREVQLQFSQTVERARAVSRRYSLFVRVTVTPPTTVNPNAPYKYKMAAYSLNRDYSTGADTYTEQTDPAPIEITLPDEFRISNVTTATDLTLMGPFGRLNSAPRHTYCFQRRNDNNLLARVDVLGVTGKVVARGLQSNGTTCP
jgi:prepilin-type N-terminal cleavage/methylation domain-containing protein